MNPDDYPARVAKVTRRDYARDALPPSTWRESLKHVALWVLLCIVGALLFIAGALLAGVPRA